MTTAALLSVALAVASVPVVFFAGYLFVLVLLSGKLRLPPARTPTTRFVYVIPAHDEEEGIAATVKSVLASEYPKELFRVLVVADNCSDATAARAREAGAEVLVRHDTERRGKGYALELAFGHVVASDSDAVVVVDADTAVSPNLLASFDARMGDGKPHALQAEYGVRNPMASWRTRLMVIALALFHVLRSRARERLGVSTGLRGNGMCFSTAVLRAVPHDAFSIVEDLEYGIKLANAGFRVEYVEEAHVLGEMVSSEKASRSQRTRWEKGRFAIAKLHGRKLLARGFATRSGLFLDLAMDVLTPPLTYVVAGSILGSALAAGLVLLKLVAPWAAAPWLISLGFLSCYILRGVALANVGVRGLLDLAWAPVYMVWKIGLALKRPSARDATWTRTAREGGEKP